MATCGSFDRFNHEGAWWVRWCGLEPGHTGSHHVQQKRTTDAEMYEGLRELRRELAGEALDPDDVPEVAETVTSVNDNPNLTKLPLSPKGIRNKAIALGWGVSACSSIVHVEATYLVADSPKPRKDGTRGRKGDLKADEKDVNHFWMRAVDPSGRVGFSAYWCDNRFMDVIVIDPLGIPTELYGDYSKSPAELAARCDELYNDGMSFLDKRHLMSTTAEFVDWLNDWAELAGIDVTRKAPRKTKEKIVDQGIGLIEAGEWSAA